MSEREVKRAKKNEFDEARKERDKDNLRELLRSHHVLQIS